MDYIETHLDEPLSIEECAKQALMSVSGYYRMFLSIVGYNVKEYIRLRRLSLACDEIKQLDCSVTEIAFKYMYNSTDSFTRAFKKQFGMLPSEIKKMSEEGIVNRFERIDLMEKYFKQDEELLQGYPDIKVIKKLEPMKVACFTYFGPEPESGAFEVMKKWAYENQISLKENAYRVFGYNHPDPNDVDNENELYGYEVCLTIPDELYEKLEDVPEGFVKGTYEGVRRRVLEGGQYAVMSVKRDGKGDIGTNIMLAWKRFGKWLDEGKYIWGGRQYLEEHIGFDDQDDHIGGVELYMPVEKVPKINKADISRYVIPKCRVAIFREEGTDGNKIAMACWKKAITWAKIAGLKSEVCHIYQYNKGFDRRPPFFHVIMITLPERFEEDKYVSEHSVNFEDFEGGDFMKLETDLCHLENSWKMMEEWRKQRGIQAKNHQWVEEWSLENWQMPAKKIYVCYPI